MVKNYYTIAVVALAALALVLGGFIVFKKWQVSQNVESLQSNRQQGVENGVDEIASKTEGISPKEFILSAGPNVQIFAIDSSNPYKGEPPVPVSSVNITDPEPSDSRSFEIWGDVVAIAFNENVIYLSSDYARPISTTFAPRGPKIFLRDLKEGDRIIASGKYDESGDANYSSIEFIQITPSLEGR